MLSKSPSATRSILPRLVLGAAFALLLTGPSLAVVGEPLTGVQRVGNCALVCKRPDEVLDSDLCRCVPRGQRPEPCGLVCPKPDESLDARHCRCVKGPGPSKD
jgi:hypothetical protein